MNNVNAKCIIIGAGDFTISEIPVSENDYVIAVDGGLSYCGILNLEPDLIIGDFDSVSDGEMEAINTLREQIPDRIITLPREKDDTDMLAAIKHGLNLGYSDFRIYAGMGGRFDHSFANVQCLLYLKNHDAVGYLIDGTGMVLVAKNEAIHLRAGLEGLLSVFCLGQKAEKVSITGMKYSLENARLTNDFPLGISNEFTGEEAVISVEDGELLCVIQYA
ncbi:MAG: thiamine diphosphokinase [Acetatifactor sp.]|jgi:thiamine pyrophosphokinase|nr:thiamine diphosphokinase [Acetatifactor sp.]